MSRGPQIVGLLAWIIATAVGRQAGAAEPERASLRLQQRIVLPGVEGRIDHFDCDVINGRLFVCALGNNSVEVLDLRTNARIRSIGGLGSPQGVAYVPASNRLFIASDQNGICRVYDANSWQPIGTIDFHDDADNLRYDKTRKEVLVGFGNGGLGVINTESEKRTGSIQLAAHPEAFAFEKKGGRIFVNVPGAGHVAVIDRGKAIVTQTWKTGAAANFPMALDETNHRLFIGCRTPSSLVVLNTDSGVVVASLKIAGDPDDIFYNASRRRLYTICGEGEVELIEQVDSDHYKIAGTVSTGKGARTGLFVPELNSLFVAVPHRGDEMAEVRRYVVP